MIPTREIALAVAALAAVALVAALAAWASRRPDGRRGRLVEVDLPGRAGTRLVSERWRLVGKPDEIRQLPDGSFVPVEWKSRFAPRGGPWRSHQVQVAAYCLLLEETTGRAPPYGIVRYRDGGEFFVAWDEDVVVACSPGILASVVSNGASMRESILVACTSHNVLNLSLELRPYGYKRSSNDTLIELTLYWASK